MSDLRTALETAFSEDEAPAPVAAPEPSPAVEPTEVKAERPRDETGKFAPKTDEPPPAPAPEPVTRKAPSSWKPAAQEAFLKADRGESLTPEEIKLLTAEAERRESDFHKGVSEFKTHSERARQYDSAIAPYQAHLQTMGVDAPTAISALLKADYTLRNSDPATRAQYFAQLAQQYGIDLGSVQAPPQLDPQTQYLMQQLNELRQSQQTWQNQAQRMEQERANAELTQFATPDKPHFDAVRGEMADLLESGRAKTLQEAYETAVWMRPEIRQSLIEQQRAEAQRKAEETLRLQRAKTASVSVKGSSPIATGSQPVKGSLREMIAAQFADN